MSELTYEDFKQRINIQEVLQDAGYHLNRKDGIRYPSYVRLDSNGRRIRGDKFIVTRNGMCCFQPPEQRNYNIISFIKEHPHFFAEYTPGMSKDRLVNLVCNRLLNQPVTERNACVLNPEKQNNPFNANDYEWQSFDLGNWENQKKFYPYFKNRGIDLATQRLFADNIFLTTKLRTNGKRYTNLSFPLTLPNKPDEKVGLEERSRPNREGKMVYKGMAAGSNATQGIWIGNPEHMALPEVRNVYWFESALDAMAFCQLNASTLNMEDSVFVSTGGSPSQEQFKGMIAETPTATHHLCFDRDRAGQVFAINFALTHAGREFSSYLSKAGNLIVQDCSKGYQRHEIAMEPFDFKKVTASLGINALKPDLEDAVFKYMEMGDGYLQEMYMNRRDNYETSRTDGATNKEELEKMENDLHAISKALQMLSRSGTPAMGNIIYEPTAEGYKDWNDQLLDKRMETEEKELDDWEISGRATLNRALSDLPEINPEHIRTGLYDEADHEAVCKRIERAEKVVQSFEINDRGIPDKGFQEMYEIQEELARLETDITNSLSGMREEYQPRFHR
jgi:hypothetical protein